MRQFTLLTVAFCLSVLPLHAQDKTILKTAGWGSLSGTVTFEGELPKPESLVPEINKLMNPDDKKCCNAAPANQKIRPNWTN